VGPVVAWLSIGIGIFAAVHPAIQAARIPPAEVMRGE
jgi:ABC-type lipoprotein release transport system permease subunit